MMNLKSPQWQRAVSKMRDADTFSPNETVQFAQSQIPFDHKLEYNQEIVEFKLTELKKEFGELPKIFESEHSLGNSIRNGYSNIFLWHLYFYLRITKEIKPKKILEIGGGYGGLARIFKTLHPDIS